MCSRLRGQHLGHTVLRDFLDLQSRTKGSIDIVSAWGPKPKHATVRFFKYVVAGPHGSGSEVV